MRTRRLLPCRSTFPLYVNTAALLWLFGFMLVEAHRASGVPCDAPLGTFVGGIGLLGVTLAVVSFVRDVFMCASHARRP